MNTAEVICTVLGTAVAVAVALGGLLGWVYRRGEAAGAAQPEGKAKIQAPEQSLLETRAELTYRLPPPYIAGTSMVRNRPMGGCGSSVDGGP